MKRFLTALLACVMLFSSTFAAVGSTYASKKSHGESVSPETGSSTTIGVLAIAPDLEVTFQVLDRISRAPVADGHLALTCVGSVLHADIAGGIATVKVMENQPYHYTVNNATGYQPWSTPTGAPVTFTKTNHTELVLLERTPPLTQAVELTILGDDTNLPLPAAYVVLHETAPDGTTVITRYSTDSGGKVLMNFKVGYTYAYEVGEGDGSLYHPYNAENISYSTVSPTPIRQTIHLVPLPKTVVLTLVAQDEATSAPLSGASISVVHEDGSTQTLSADAQGEARFTLAVGERISYTVSHSGYNAKSQSGVAFHADERRIVALAQSGGGAQYARITLTVVDDKTGAALSGAHVTLLRANGRTETLRVNAQGMVTFQVTAGELFDYTVSAAGYRENSYTGVSYYNDTSREERLTSPNDGGQVPLTFAVTAQKTHQPLSNASISVSFADGTSASVVTNISGIATVRAPLGQHIRYAVQCEGYWPVSVGGVLVDDALYIPVELEKDTGITLLDDLTIHVVNDKTGEVMPGATVTITHGDGTVTTVIADENGDVVVSVAKGDTISYVVSSEGYLSNTVTAFVPRVGETISERLIPREIGDAALDSAGSTVTVAVENESGTPISGAIVRIYNKDGVLLGTKVTDQSGKVSWQVKEGGAYHVSVFATGFYSAAGTFSGSATLRMKLKAVPPRGDAPQGTPVIAPDSAPIYPVTVDVVDENSRIRLVGAVVRLYSRSGAVMQGCTVDDAPASFRVPSGVYYFTINKAGYAPLTTKFYRITADVNSRNFTLSLAKEASPEKKSFVGIVENQQGERLKNANVLIFNREKRQVGTAVTDKRGMFSQLLPDSAGYYVEIERSGYRKYISVPFAVFGAVERTFVLAPIELPAPEHDIGLSLAAYWLIVLILCLCILFVLKFSKHCEIQQ